MTGVKAWQFGEGSDGSLYLSIIDEYGYSFTLRMELLDAEMVIAALTDFSERNRRTLATARRPTLEADVAAAIDRITRDRGATPA